jgi:hypothetical protein
VEDDALVHSGRGPFGGTSAASDEAKARMETKAAVEIAYMERQTLRQKSFCSNGGEQTLILYPRTSEARVTNRRMPPRRVYTCGISAECL